MSANHLTNVIPAYNEGSRILRTLEAVAQFYRSMPYDFDVIVVNDGSTDNTMKIVETFCESNPEFRAAGYPINQGKGAAVKVGMMQATGELILFMDADLATPLEETDKLVSAIESGADIAIGSRPLKESNLEIRQPWYREQLGRLFNFAVQSLSIRGIKDTQCGFKIFKKHAAHDIFSRTKLNRFGFDFEALMTGRDLGYKIAEIPIRWSHQEGSKVVLMRDGPQMIKDLIKLRLKGKKWRLTIRN